MRSAIADARRIVVKIGSSSLTLRNNGLATDRIDALVDVLAERQKAGAQVVLVSSGAIAAGMAPLGLARRPRDLATQQASASVGQMLLVARYATSFERYGLTVGQVLLTADDVIRRAHYRNASRNFERLLELGVVPIVNENDAVATDEIRFGDNDRLAALVAHLLRADALVLLSDVDGLYSGDPRRPGAQLVPFVSSASDLLDVVAGSTGASGVGTGGMASKVAAAQVATSAGVHVVLTSATHAAGALVGEDVGTYFAPTGRRLPTRLLWLRHATTPRGQLLLDDGAVEAVVSRRASLLSAGITGVTGDFVAGDPVDLVSPAGVSVARGLVAYDAAELPPLLGKSTHAVGPKYRREVVHRDDLALL
ncbi:glutamate 5-kinase [Cryptosporangium aurantiacum]|uniref:Glutamate 5-kinase n=1 Tax=Cryptosporangium aurantiacum TaxID=134849 RepID=A0A1M7Q781_9ACTN|nr:glutamate 5-kinase [Cryptosporangium aurantiacum]SHN26037.1 glutamate 5-kinase [Cryptosporangium aurantiacum]